MGCEESELVLIYPAWPAVFFDLLISSIALPSHFLRRISSLRMPPTFVNQTVNPVIHISKARAKCHTEVNAEFIHCKPAWNGICSPRCSKNYFEF